MARCETRPVLSAGFGEPPGRVQRHEGHRRRPLGRLHRGADVSTGRESPWRRWRARRSTEEQMLVTVVVACVVFAVVTLAGLAGSGGGKSSRTAADPELRAGSTSSTTRA